MRAAGWVWAGLSLAGVRAQVPAITVQSNLVVVPALVQGAKGELLYGLKAGEFVLKDNGVPQVVRVEEEAEGSALSVVVVVQCSGAAAREQQHLRGLATMVEALEGDAAQETAVVFFGSEPELVGGFTKNAIRTHEVLTQYEPCDADGDAIFDAVDYAAGLLEKRDPHRRRVILLISETRDHGSESKPGAVVARLGRSNIVVDAVTFSPGKSQLLDEVEHGGPPGAKTDYKPLLVMAVEAARKNAPKEFVNLSGGEYINFTTQKGFDRSLGMLANHVHNGYLLSFQPRGVDGKAPAPGLHQITVGTPGLKSTVRHRQNYWVGDATGVDR